LPSITAEDVVKLFEEDVKARKRLAELLVSEPDVRLAVISAVLRDVATKGDVESLRREFKSDVEALRSDVEGLRRDVFAHMSELRERVSKLEGAFTQLADRIGDLDKRIDSLDKRIDGLDRRIDALDKRIDSLDKRMDYATKVSWALVASVLVTLAAQLVLLLMRAH